MFQQMTPRLCLRELNTDDAENFYLLNSDPEVLKYTGDVPFKTIEEALLFLANYDQYKKYGIGRWAIIHKETKEFLGWCGLKYDPETEGIDLGFRLFQKHWNKGYATEAARTCLAYGFSHFQFNEIIGRAMTANIASVNTLTKLGFTFRQHFNFNEKEGVMYGITRQAWKDQQ